MSESRSDTASAATASAASFRAKGEREPAFCAAVDWGTTSFRLWLLSAGGDVLAERRSGEGLTTAMELGFETVLSAHLDAVCAAAACPVVMCGMVGARQGWHEARYLDSPAALASIAECAVRVPGADREIRILPGIAQRDRSAPDVMRGEETQLMGAAAAGAFGSDPAAATRACLPGTHSKWATIRDGTIERFATAMTGELFTLITDRSILRHTLHDAPDVAPEDPVFVDAVRAAFANPGEWTGGLFRLRAGPLLDAGNTRNGKAWLSGSLIGAEFAAALDGAGAARDDEPPVVLIASGSLLSLYGAALEACGIAFTHVDADAAVRSGLHAAARRIFSNASEPLR